MGKKGHYEGQSMCWEEGERPKCECCGGLATLETPTSGVVICEKPECMVRYVEDNCEPIEFVEDED